MKPVIERLKKQNKIRDNFKKQRISNVSVPQQILFNKLKKLGRDKHFKPALERELYTLKGVRFSDIFIKKYGLNIEIDGEYHLSEEQVLKDSIREQEIWIKKKIITVRFMNSQIIENCDTVLKKIEGLLAELDPLPNWKSPGKGTKRVDTYSRRKEIYERYR